MRRSPCLAALAAAVLLSGCGRLSDYARVAEGNRLSARGDYQEAIVAYLGSGRAGRDADEADATIDYDVANVYARLGEYDAAAELYGAARRGGERPIVADSFFNEGVALFERGRYEDSWKAFRSALGLFRPSSPEAEEARRNLELAWRSWKKSAGSPSSRVLTPSSSGSGAGDESEQRLLQRLETGRWRPGAAPASASGSADY
jgi:tetratricopeptide (TPR) repeat protein